MNNKPEFSEEFKEYMKKKFAQHIVVLYDKYTIPGVDNKFTYQGDCVFDKDGRYLEASEIANHLEKLGVEDCIPF